MAILSADKQYVTTQKGDTLSAIAKKYLGAAKKYQQLAKINNISNPNKISVGRKIYLYSKPSSDSSSSSSTSSSSSNSKKVTITDFGIQTNSDNTLFVTWNWSKSNTESYLVEWTYHTGDGVWFVGNSGTNTVDSNAPALSRQSTYDIPANAKKVRVRIKPVSKKYTKNKKETSYWTAEWSDYKTYTDSTQLATPDAPNVELENYNLKISLDNIKISGAKQIEFQIYKNDGSSAYKTGKATITSTNSVSYSCTVDSGAEYKVRCRAINGSTISEWSDFSDGVSSAPSAISIKSCKGTGETSIKLEWNSSKTAKTYEVEYATKKTHFDITDQTTVKSGIEGTVYLFEGLESGNEYFFRVRAVSDAGESAWSSIVSVVIGMKPSAPTTWSSTTTCIVGEELTLYWIHNSMDGSSQSFAILELTVNGKTKEYTIRDSGAFLINSSGSISTIETFKDDESTVVDESIKTNYCKIDTTRYSDGMEIQWRVKTAGVTKSYGDWSVQRTVDVYAPPTLELGVTDANGNSIETLTSFPFYIYGLPGPNNQTPVSYHVSIVANESYQTVDDIGNEINVNAREEVYSQYFDTSSALYIELLPSSINLENNINYTVTCVVSMDSGLSSESSYDFSVSWVDEIYAPNAEIGYDEETYTTHIHPYCMSSQELGSKIEYRNGVYYTTDEIVDVETLDDVYTETGETVYVGIMPNGIEEYYCIVYIDEEENPIDPIYHIVDYTSGAYHVTDEIIEMTDITPVYTSTGEQVLMGINEAGDEIRYCSTESTSLVDDITLSVYRREFDGSFVEIASGLDNASNTYVTDPHPALDYARYRIVAVSNATGAISYYDVPGYPIGEHAIIIQWDEEWSEFDTPNNDETYQPPWTGSLLRLPYNIDVSDNSNQDVVHVEYIGRKHPVSYYGTHLGSTSTWNTEIPSTDKDTIYALRRLMTWMGDVYVREPSGTGYWANIKVSFNQKHRSLTIPVTLDITRVEGGI